jgi:hypothetical protein
LKPFQTTVKPIFTVIASLIDDAVLQCKLHQTGGIFYTNFLQQIATV